MFSYVSYGRTNLFEGYNAMSLVVQTIVFLLVFCLTLIILLFCIVRVACSFLCCFPACYEVIAFVLFCAGLANAASSRT